MENRMTRLNNPAVFGLCKKLLKCGTTPFWSFPFSDQGDDSLKNTFGNNKNISR
jgi:hypothetical protein